MDTTELIGTSGRSPGSSSGAITTHRGFRVGGVSVSAESQGNDHIVLDAQLEPFGMECNAADVTIRVEWATDLRTETQKRVFDSGSIWRLYDSTAGFQFDFRAPAFGDQPYKRLLIDSRFRCGTLQLNRVCRGILPNIGGTFGYPLDELLIMHRLTQEKAIELHGTGIVRDNGDANLFVGHSGAGKSTTTRLWTSVEEVEVLSDDRIIVRRDETATADLGADDCANEVGILRLRDRSASPNGHFAKDDKRISHFAQDDKQIPRFARNDKRMRMYGTPWHGEAMFASPNSAPLSRIFVLEHGHGNVITPLTPSQAVAELFARSFVPFHRHEYVDSALVFLEELANSVPVYRYSFEPDQRAVEKIRKFRD